jgi:hypothetical protein
VNSGTHVINQCNTLHVSAPEIEGINSRGREAIPSRILGRMVAGFDGESNAATNMVSHGGYRRGAGSNSPGI